MFTILIRRKTSRVIANEVRQSLRRWGVAREIARDLQLLEAGVSARGSELVLMDISLPYYNGYYW
jgi:DNA-binding response OmpR family regulator